MARTKVFVADFEVDSLNHLISLGATKHYFVKNYKERNINLDYATLSSMTFDTVHKFIVNKQLFVARIIVSDPVKKNSKANKIANEAKDNPSVTSCKISLKDVYD